MGFEWKNTRYFLLFQEEGEEKKKHILYSVVYKKLYTLTCGSDAQLERAPVLG